MPGPLKDVEPQYFLYVFLLWGLWLCVCTNFINSLRVFCAHAKKKNYEFIHTKVIQRLSSPLIKLFYLTISTGQKAIWNFSDKFLYMYLIVRCFNEKCTATVVNECDHCLNRLSI